MEPKTKPLWWAASSSRFLLWCGAACLALGWVVKVIAAAARKRVARPNWLILVAVTGNVLNVLRPTHSTASDWVVLAMGVLTIAAVIGLLVLRP